MTAQRNILPNRRACERIEFDHNRIRYWACIGRYPDGRIAEIFLSTNKAGTDLDATARDAALLFSLAIQHGCPVETIAGALSRDNHGHPAGPLGRVIEMVTAAWRKDSDEP